MNTITFHSFKNGVRPFAFVVAYLDLSEIANLAKKGGRLCSKVVEAHLNEPRNGHTEPDTGIITVGAFNREVGRFTINRNSTQL